MHVCKNSIFAMTYAKFVCPPPSNVPMNQSVEEQKTVQSDNEALRRMGYQPELDRRMNGFSNYAISMATICVLSGGITSFYVGFCSVGGASIGLGWPLACLFSLSIALTMAQVASAFPTAGGPYHWASILSGRAWGWATACFNLAGLVTAIAAVNVGTVRFVFNAMQGIVGYDAGPLAKEIEAPIVILMTLSQALINHWGIRLTSRLTDFSGYLIVVVSVLLTGAMILFGVILAGNFDPSRLITFLNNSGRPSGAGEAWPH